MTQGAYWVNSWGFQIPFPGMDTKGCKYLRHNCMNEIVSENQDFSYPVKILTAYPPVSLKYVDIFFDDYKTHKY